MAAPHTHPVQEERFEVVDGVMGYRLGDHRGELRAGAAITVPPAATVAPIARRRGRSVTGDVMRAAIVPEARWPT